jgi:hypothetical protein
MKKNASVNLCQNFKSIFNQSNGGPPTSHPRHKSGSHPGVSVWFSPFLRQLFGWVFFHDFCRFLSWIYGKQDGKQESYEDMNEAVYCYSVGYIVSSVRCSRLNDVTNGYHDDKTRQHNNPRPILINSNGLRSEALIRLIMKQMWWSGTAHWRQQVRDIILCNSQYAVGLTKNGEFTPNFMAV